MLRRKDIVALLPHGESMVMLDRVVHFDANTIQCTAESHRDANNPLRVNGVLPALAGVEYGAQAMALHGALASAPASAPPKPGLLAALRNVELFCQRLDIYEDELTVEAGLLAVHLNAARYDFALSVRNRTLCRGQANVVFLEDGAP